MVKFCKNCDNLLDSNYHNDELTFKCKMCNVVYPPNDEDSLRYERHKQADVMIYEKILEKAADDPASLKALIDCINPDCPGKLVAQVRIGEELYLYNICTECKTQWLN